MTCLIYADCVDIVGQYHTYHRVIDRSHVVQSAKLFQKNDIIIKFVHATLMSSQQNMFLLIQFKSANSIFYFILIDEFEIQ